MIQGSSERPRPDGGGGQREKKNKNPLPPYSDLFLSELAEPIASQDYLIS